MRDEEEAPPDIAQLAEHLTVDLGSDQMVPGSIPGVRIWLCSGCLLCGSVWLWLFVVWACSARYYMQYAETRDRAGDLQIFSLTLSQLSYRGLREKRVRLLRLAPRSPTLLSQLSYRGLRDRRVCLHRRASARPPWRDA